MRFVEGDGLTFDDVLLVPRFNEIESRQDVCLKTRLTKDTEIECPLISANMDTVTGALMMVAMSNIGGVGILHRFMDLDDTRKAIEYFQKYLPPSSIVCTSLGVNGEAKERLELLIELKVDVICVDVAHGYSKSVIKMIEYIRGLCDIQIIAGNVATPSATKDLIHAGAHAIKVGIGPGSLCSTRLVTGCGVPQLSAIIECSETAKEYNVPIIADGGFRYSGDCVKALAAGAESIMSGSFFSGTEEAPGEIVEHKGKKYKKYQGMASKDAMVGWKGPGYHAAPEGEATLTPYKGTVKEVAEPILAGIRSGLTYNGVRNLDELQENAIFRRISPNCLTENQPHGKF